MGAETAAPQGTGQTFMPLRRPEPRGVEPTASWIGAHRWLARWRPRDPWPNPGTFNWPHGFRGPRRHARNPVEPLAVGLEPLDRAGGPAGKSCGGRTSAGKLSNNRVLHRSERVEFLGTPARELGTLNERAAGGP
jgi:hypothetical protein